MKHTHVWDMETNRKFFKEFIPPAEEGPSDADEKAMEDEIALRQLAEAVEYLSPKVVLPVTGGGYEPLVSLCKSALAHLRRRLLCNPDKKSGD